MKTLIIIKREYLTRVKKKSFILLTLLIPILMIGLMGGSAYLTTNTISSKSIAIYNEKSTIEEVFTSTKNIDYTLLDVRPSTDEIHSLIKDGTYDAYLYIPDFNIHKETQLELLTHGEIGIEFEQRIFHAINDKVIALKMEEAGISSAKLSEIEKKTIKINAINTEGKSSNSEISLIIGYISGIVLYFFMLFYGMNVMSSVAEEKTNRIAEIIVSSVRPFQLMLGKIIGVALVGLTQFFIWAILLIGISIVLGVSGLAGQADISQELLSSGQEMPINQEMIENISQIISQVNWLHITLWFIFYFLGGYFLYAALFAAVGSLVNENAQEGQQYTIPITIPIILGFLIMTSTMQDPNNNIAVFGSIFPMTSPIVMMARIPYGVPTWQLLLSASLLIIGFIATTWLAAKIYRTGILMYGKKISFKELGRWIWKS